ncbi:MAG: tetratricopeptide repeat protein [Myxococcota bacterium]
MFPIKQYFILIILVSVFSSCSNNKENEKENKEQTNKKIKRASESSSKSKTAKKDKLTSREDSLLQDKDLPDNVKKMLKTCKKGSPSACMTLSKFFRRGWGVDKNLDLAAKFQKKAYSRYQKIIPIWKKNCQKGQGKFCLDLGMAWRDGLGVKKDKDKAMEFFKKALSISKNKCEQKNAAACYTCGRIHQMGVLAGRGKKEKPQPEEVKKAMKYYKQACEYKNSRACYSVGKLHRDGIGVERNREKALKFFNKACELDKDKKRKNPFSCRVLEKMKERK